MSERINEDGGFGVLAAAPSALHRSVVKACSSIALIFALWFVASATSAGPGIPGPIQGGEQDPGAVLDRIADSCRTHEPYFVTTHFAYADSGRGEPDAPAILAFRGDGAATPESRIVLATQADVGSVYGLAYDPPSGMLYAAAYHKRSTVAGPGGPGAVYALDLRDGSIRKLTELFAGRAMHDLGRDDDAIAAETVGIAGLGDIELSPDGSELFVTNLAEGRIYRLSSDTGSELSNFRHGAVNEAWARNARLMGLGWHEGWLYHGLVDSREFSETPGALSAHLYRSRPDGGAMERVVEVDLRYVRPVSWLPWQDVSQRVVRTGDVSGYVVSFAQPMLADIVFDHDGRPVLGFRDRLADILPSLLRNGPVHPGLGDVLPLRMVDPDEDGPEVPAWQAQVRPEHYEDFSFGGIDESAMGGLARFPGFDMLVGSAVSPAARGDIGAHWWWNQTGDMLHSEVVALLVGAGGEEDRVANGFGDVESLCADEIQPEVVPTATAIVATATAAAGATQTIVALTPTSVPIETPENFDEVITEACSTENPYAITVCYPPLGLGWGVDTAMVVGFLDTPADQPQYGMLFERQSGSVHGLAYDRHRHQLYASAFLKRMLAFGPGGTGAIYRVQVPDGTVEVFAQVPDAGADPHQTIDIVNGDRSALRWVAKMSLGDIDLGEEDATLFAMNLRDRRIYRYDTETAALLGSFEHGAVAEEWANDARPFALKFYEGRLYHGLVHSAQSSVEASDLAAYVYSSLADGSDMRLEVRVGLDYDRGTAIVPGVIQNPQPQELSLDWNPWVDRYVSLGGTRAQTSVYPQPILSDIEFDDAGGMHLGIRDRQADMAAGTQIATPGMIEKPGLGIGDLLHVPFDGQGWASLPPDLNHYGQPSDSEADRSHIGGLAKVPFFDLILANRLKLLPAPPNLNPGQGGVSPAREGVVWHDAAGNQIRQERICANPITRRAGRRFLDDVPVFPNHSEWLPGKGMGDVEVLCGPTLTPTLTPVISPTPSITPSRTPSVTPSSTLTPSPTLTPVPQPIYLPISIADECSPATRHVDVVLVLDASTTMLFDTRAGRKKIEAAKEATGLFLDRMDFAHDQAALVMFNAEATVLSRLSSDRTALDTALAAIENRQQTRIHLGMDAARELLQSAERKAANQPTIVLLTDGRSNPDPAQMAVDAALKAKDAGIAVFTVGLGDDVEHDILRAMASRPEDYYHAPDGEDLGPIYEQIAVEIPCPPSAFWPFRP